MKPRRWFRFNLRTIFALLTVFGVWLAVQVNWIRQRHALLGPPEHTGVDPSFISRVMSLSGAPDEFETRDAPWPLRWLGERGVYALDIRDDMPESEVARIRALFPEAEVELSPKDGFEAD